MGHEEQIFGKVTGKNEKVYFQTSPLNQFYPHLQVLMTAISKSTKYESHEDGVLIFSEMSEIEIGTARPGHRQHRHQ